jgi:hypothetical protein
MASQIGYFVVFGLGNEGGTDNKKPFGPTKYLYIFTIYKFVCIIFHTNIITYTPFPNDNYKTF